MTKKIAKSTSNAKVTPGKVAETSETDFGCVYTEIIPSNKYCPSLFKNAMPLWYL